ncbi:hypothetical protein HFP72_30130 [Nocardiopsis sp. ARC36]
MSESPSRTWATAASLLSSTRVTAVLGRRLSVAARNSVRASAAELLVASLTLFSSPRARAAMPASRSRAPSSRTRPLAARASPAGVGVTPRWRRSSSRSP